MLFVLVVRWIGGIRVLVEVGWRVLLVFVMVGIKGFVIFSIFFYFSVVFGRCSVFGDLGCFFFFSMEMCD